MDKTGGFFLVIILAMLLIWVAVNPNLTDMLANNTVEDNGTDDGGGSTNSDMTPRERHNQQIINYNKKHGVDFSSSNMSNALGAASGKVMQIVKG